MFFIVPFNPSPIHTRSLSSVGVTVCASCQALTCPMAAVFTHATTVQYVVAFQINSPASVYLLPTSNKLCGLLFFRKVLLALSFQE